MKKYTHLNEVSIDESFSDSGFVLGVDENGDVVRVPKATMGKVKSVNGNQPDENGNIEIPMNSAGGVKTVNGKQPDENGDVKVCEALKDVGEQGFEPLRLSGGSIMYDFLLSPWTGTDIPSSSLYYNIGGTDLLSNPAVHCFEVNLDNVTYLCPTHLVLEDGTMYTHQYIGNGSMAFEDEEDDGLPFIIYFDEYNNEWRGKVSTDGEHGMSIIGGTYTTTQIPEELVSQKVIAIPLDELKNYTNYDLKEMLRNNRVINLLEYDFEDHSWRTYTLAGQALDDGGGPMGDLVFTCLSAKTLVDPNFEDVSAIYEIRTIIFMESVENHYLKITKDLS